VCVKPKGGGVGERESLTVSAGRNKKNGGVNEKKREGPGEENQGSTESIREQGEGQSER